MTELEAYATEINRVSKLVQDLRSESDRRISEALTTVNNAITRIDDLNPLIAREQKLGGDATSLIEQRDRAIAERRHRNRCASRSMVSRTHRLSSER